MASGAEARVNMPSVSELQKSPEVKTKEYSAFLQVFMKQRDELGIPRISCLSYPLQGDINASQARAMMSEILGPNPSNITNIRDYYHSPEGELQFMAREGVTDEGIHGMLGRYLGVPERELGINQTRRKEELLGGVLREFHAGLQGKRHESAQDSKGKTIYAFTYRVDEESGAIIGKNVKGEEGPRLSELAMKDYPEHGKMLSALEKRLFIMEEGVVLNFDASPTVDICCKTFFNKKLAGVGEEVAESQEEKVVKEIMPFYFGDLSKYKESEKCSKGHQLSECTCVDYAELAAGE